MSVGSAGWVAGWGSIAAAGVGAGATASLACRPHPLSPTTGHLKAQARVPPLAAPRGPRVPAYYALILRSLTVLEGLALQADPK